MNNEKNENIVSQGQNQPEKTFRVGQVNATVWRNMSQTERGSVEYLSVSFDKRYMDKQTKTWKSSSSLRVNDLPKAVLALNKAYEYVLLSSKSQQFASEEN